MPAMMGKAKAQQKLLDNLEDEFAKVYIIYESTNFVFLKILL